MPCPLVVLFPNYDEIDRRQGMHLLHSLLLHHVEPGVLQAPDSGAPSRTWEAVIDAIAPHCSFIDINKVFIHCLLLML